MSYSTVLSYSVTPRHFHIHFHSCNGTCCTHITHYGKKIILIGRCGEIWEQHILRRLAFLTPCNYLKMGTIVAAKHIAGQQRHAGYRLSRRLYICVQQKLHNALGQFRSPNLRPCEELYTVAARHGIGNCDNPCAIR